MTHRTNVWTRITSFLVALVMVLGMLPAGGLHIHAHAAEAVTMTGGEVLYLKPNSNWVMGNARFAAYFFGEGYTWADLEPVPDNEGYYQVTAPEGSWTNVIFCRMNPTTGTNDWTYKWNQTDDLSYDGVNNLFTVPDGSWDGAITGWSQWTPAVSEPCDHEGHSKERCALCGLTEGIHSYDETTHLCACGAVEEFTVIILDIHMDSEIGRITAPYGSDISAQAAEIVEAINQQDPGYTFSCWIDTTSWEEAQLTTMPGENITVLTVVTFLKFDIFYYAGGELYHTAQTSYTSSYKYNEPETAPTREGYTFAGWVYYSSYDAETGVFSDEYTGTRMANHTLYANAQWNCAHPNLECTDNGDGQTHRAVCEDCGELVDEAQAHGAPYTAVFNWPEAISDYMEVYVSVQCACGSEVDCAYVQAEQYEYHEAVDCSNSGFATYGIVTEIGGEPYEDFKNYTILSDDHVAVDENGFCACGGYQSAYYNEETGVYEISNAGQLYWYARELNETNAEIHAKLTADITIPDDAPPWEPINASYVFFDGDFHTISGLTCIGDENMTYVGLFGYEGWWYEISNLHITNSHFDGSGYVGAVVACMTNGGIVTNCAVTNTTVIGSGDYVGTLAGYLSAGSVVNCFVDTNRLTGGYSSGYARIENSYYLFETETEDGGRTAEQFASGEVAYLLQAGQEPGYDYDDEGNEIEVPAPKVWGQTIGTDSFPVLGGQTVYYGYTSCSDDAQKHYTNDAAAAPEKPDHTRQPVCTDNGDGTHSAVYPCCGDKGQPEPHTADAATGICICGVAYQAKIGDTWFITLSAAAEAAAEGDTITVATDVTIGAEETLAFAHFVTLDVAEGKNITCDGTVTIGGEAGILFENALYYHGGTAGANWEIDEVAVPTYWDAEEGYAIFLPAQGETESLLILHNATINPAMSSSDDGAVTYSDPLTIRFSGTSTLTANDHTVSAVFHIRNHTTLVGTGENPVLNIHGGSTDNEVKASSFQSLTVSSGTVTFRAGNGGFASIGVNVSETLTVEAGATLNAIGGNAAEYYSTGLVAQALVVEGTLNASRGASGTGEGAFYLNSDIALLADSVSGSGTINGMLWILDSDSLAMIHRVYGSAAVNHDFTAYVLDGASTTFTVPAGTTLTVAADVTLDLSSLAVADIDFSGTVINNGTILLPEGFPLEDAPKGGNVTIGTQAHRWDEGMSKWVCAGEHIGELVYVDLGEDYHKAYYDCCQAAEEVEAVPHSYDETTLLCPCGAASPDAVAVLSKNDIPVKAYTDLTTAGIDATSCTAEDQAVLKLLKSVDLGEEYLSLYNGTYTLDLNSFTITSAAPSTGAVYVSGGTDLIIRNGTIVGKNSCVQMAGGKLTLMDMTLTDATVGIYSNGGEAVLHRCDIRVLYGMWLNGGSVAVYDSTINAASYDVFFFSGTVAFHEGTEFTGGIVVNSVTLADVLGEGMAYWQDGIILTIDADSTEILGSDVTVKAVCTHENGDISYTCKDADSHYVTYSCCGVAGIAELHSFGEDGACTACGFDPNSAITIHMTDSYGDGWTGNAIRVFADGIPVGTATFDEGSTGTWAGIYDPEKEYEFYWVRGSYPDECGFEILILEETVFTASTEDCGAFPDGYRVYPVCGHDYGEGVVTAPTCVDQGYTTYTCALCGFSYEDDYVDSLGGHVHAEDDAGVVTDPTCDESGYTTYTCSLCGESYTTDYVDALGHSKGDQEGIVTAPNCYAQGYTTYTCAVCGERYSADYVEPLGHTLGEDGNCSVCGELYTVPVWVEDTQIDAENLTDILGDGTASFDPVTKTLTLNGYQGGGINAKIPLNILLLGENSIESSEYGLVFDIYDGEISIGGTGSLDVYSAYEGINVCGGNVKLTIGGSVTVNLMAASEGIWLDANTAALVIKDSATVIAGTEATPLEEECIYVYGESSGSVTITGSASFSCATNDEEGIYVGGNAPALTISGSATVYAVGDEEGLDADTVTISGGTVTAIGGVGYEGIYADDLIISGGTVTAMGDGQGIEADNITITGGTVTVTGGGMIATAYYVEGELVCGTITLGQGMAITAPEGAVLGELDLTAEDEGPVMTVLNPDGTMADTFTISASNAPIVITQQPEDCEGSLGGSAVFTVTAEGEGLTYQWYYYNVGDGEWKKSSSSGSNTATVSPVFYGYRDGQQYRCVITDVHGNTATSEAAAMILKADKPAISGSSGDVEGGALGRIYTFSVNVTGENLSYRWEYSADSGETWTKTWLEGYDTDTLTVKFNLNRNGNLYRCVITSAGKESVTSEPMGLYLQAESVRIVGQPENVKVAVGETATFTVVAEGTDLSYAWFRSNDGGTTWSKTYLPGYDTDTLSFEANSDRAVMFHCKVTDGSGKTICTQQVKLSLSAELMTGPESITRAVGETATFSVVARGENLKYRWYYSADGGETWKETWLDGYNTDTLSFAVDVGRAAKLYKCVITDRDGETLETDAVSVTIG